MRGPCRPGRLRPVRLRPAALRALALASFCGPAGGPLAAQVPGAAHPDAGSTATSATARVVPVEREAHAMGTLLRVRASARDRRSAIRASEAALEAVRRTEERLSTWRPDTELTAVNEAPAGRPVTASGPLADLLVEVADWSRRTDGAFDPAVGALLEAWDLRGAGRRPAAGELERARAATGLRCFELDAVARTVRKRCPGAWLDTGAFGKGAALREARGALEASGAHAALLDFGGQLLAWSASGTEPRPTIGIAHPSRREVPVLRIRLPDRSSVATTGQSERGAAADGERIGHVVDPRTGRPVPAWGSVTVVAGDPLVADLLSTALFVMGPERGLAWLEGREGIAALFLAEEGGRLEARANEPMRALLAEATEATPGGAEIVVEGHR